MAPMHPTSAPADPSVYAARVRRVLCTTARAWNIVDPASAAEKAARRPDRRPARPGAFDPSQPFGAGLLAWPGHPRAQARPAPTAPATLLPSFAGWGAPAVPRIR